MAVSKSTKIGKHLRLGGALKKKKVGEMTYGDLHAIGKAIHQKGRTSSWPPPMCCCAMCCCAAAVTSFKEMGEAGPTTSPAAI